jgi:hypothetical protein
LKGWTTYLERLLERELHGEAARQLSFVTGQLLFPLDCIVSPMRDSANEQAGRD